MVKSGITTRQGRTESFLDSLPPQEGRCSIGCLGQRERQKNRLFVWLLGLDVIRASELQKEPAFVRCDLMTG